MKIYKTVLLIIAVSLLSVPVYSADKLTIAVLDFEGQNVSAMDARVITGFLRTAIVNADIYRVVDRDNMEKILAEQGLQMTGCTTQDCAVKIGNILSVEKMVMGTLSKLIDTYHVTANIVDVETGEIDVSKREKCESSRELDAAMDRLALRLLNRKADTVPAPKDVKQEESTLNMLHLESINAETKPYTAAINGTDLNKGDIIMDAKIISIKTDYVKIKYKNLYYKLDLEGNKTELRK